MDESCRRIHGRRLLEGLVCSLGPVLDLSAGGMRVLTTRKREGTATVELCTPECTLTLAARVAWSQRIGFRRHMIGLEFLDVDAQTAAALCRIASGYSKKWSVAS